MEDGTDGAILKLTLFEMTSNEKDIKINLHYNTKFLFIFFLFKQLFEHTHRWKRSKIPERSGFYFPEGGCKFFQSEGVMKDIVNSKPTAVEFFINGVI